jgi:RNA polymerase sigma-B factor
VDPGIAAADLRATLSSMVRRLPEREQRILELRFVHGMSQAQIGEVLGVSQMRVSRLLARSLATLRALWN